MPALTALSSAACTFGLVGVIAMAFTSCTIMFSMMAISPSSSVPLLPWPKMTSTSACSASYFLTASTMCRRSRPGTS